MAGDSVHKKKERIRPPRVHISYEVELNGAQVMKELPFVVGVVADLSGQPKTPLERMKDRKFVEIDRDNFDGVLKSMKPRLAMKVDNKLENDGSELSVELNFEKLGDFRPENVAKQVKPLADLIEVRNQLRDLLGRTEGNDRLEELLGAIIENKDLREKLKSTLQADQAGTDSPGRDELIMAKEKAGRATPINELVEQDGGAILDDLLTTGIKARDDSSREHGQSLIRNLVQQLLDPGMKVQKGVTKTINARIAAIDVLLSDQLNEIMHHPDFQKLEGSWRGLNSMVMNSETGETLKIRVFNTPKKDLLRDFQSASEFTESALWKKIYEYEFGLYGGDPFGCLIGDFEFDKGPQDIELLEQITQVAAAAHAPFIAATAPGMFGMESFTQMPDPRDIAKIFDKANPQNTKWLSFRDSEDSRFCCLTMPHVLMRLPYGKDNPVDDFNFVEDVDGEDHDKYLWGSSAYSFGLRLTDAFSKHHWCVAIRGPEGGGLVEGLPIHTFKSREGDVGSKCPTEVLIPDTREKELSDLGFIPLIHCKNTDYAAFFGANSVQRPKKYDEPAATANAKLSSQIQYLMATSRIAHYLKAICRDKVGSFVSRGQCEQFLNNWISNYVLDQDNATQEAKARRPLREARIDVTDDKSKPGSYRAIAYLRPHFQLEELNVSLRLVAELPAAAK